MVSAFVDMCSNVTANTIGGSPSNSTIQGSPTTSASVEISSHPSSIMPTTHKGAQSFNHPPIITSEFRPEYFLNKISNLALQCQAYSGNIKYYWYQNGRKVENQIQITANITSGYLRITNYTKDNFGVFYCVAENDYGASVSPFVKISEAVLDKFRNIRPLSMKSCEEYDHCKLDCSYKPRCEPHDACQFEWTHGIGTQNTVSEDENIAIDLDGNLHFLNISKDFENKTYACGIWNEQTRTLNKGSSTKLFIEASTYGTSPRPVFHSNSRVHLGKHGVLQCLFSGTSMSEIKWKNKHGLSISTNNKYRTSQYGRILHVMNVTYNDEGSFTCETENNLAQTPYLNVTSPPVFPENGKSFLTTNFTIYSEEFIRLTCNAVSSPMENHPVVTHWMKNGSKITSFQDFSIQLLENNRVLKINRAVIEKVGGIQCVTENSEGIAVVNFLINYVKGPFNLFYLAVLVFAIGVLVLIAFGFFNRKRCYQKFMPLYLVIRRRSTDNRENNYDNIAIQ
ncbi:neural cell adhesion molecule L1 isoform X2 [Magallana gigas]|uniref:neural cell adhesion molecule L1 isoform X2 n=1 Tax=Magallana gigas TaxID=29159 RepID=UPI00333F83F0